MLELKHITYRVQDGAGEKTILDDVNLTVDEHFVAFTGPNGGGNPRWQKLSRG